MRWNKVRGNIRRRVTIGFTVILVFLSIVSFFSVRGLNRLNHIVNSTDLVYALLDAVYQVRIGEKNLVLREDEAINKRVDSLMGRINQLVMQIENQKVMPVQRNQLEPMVNEFTQYHKNYQILWEFIAVKKNLGKSLDSLFYSIEGYEKRPEKSMDLLKQPNTMAGITMWDELHLIHAEFLKVRFLERSLDLNADQGEMLERIDAGFDKILAYTFMLENESDSRKLKTEVAAFRKELRLYEQKLVRYAQIKQGMHRVMSDLRQGGARMQKLVWEAALLQSEQQAVWGKLSLRFLIVLVLLALLGGIGILLFFIRKIRNDEMKQQTIEQEIDKNRRLLDDIVNNSISLIYVKNLEGRYSLVNQIWCKQMQIEDKSDVIGHLDSEFFPQEKIEQWRETDLKVLQHDKALFSEEELDTVEGRRYYLSNKFPIHDKDGKAIAVCGMSTDITDLKNALKELEKSKENYRNIVANVPGIVYNGLNDDGRTMLFLSVGFEKLTGFERENFIGGIQTFTNLIVPEDRPLVLDTIYTAVSRNQSYEVEYRIEDAKGKVRWLHEKGMAGKSPASEELVLQGVIIDVTGQKEAMSEVILRDRFLQGVADAVKELIIGDNAQASIRKSLRIVGQSAIMDKAFVFKNDVQAGDEVRSTSHWFEWNAGTLDPVTRSDLQGIGFETISSRWYYLLSDKVEISGNRSDFDAEEQFFFDHLSLESILLVPVFARHVFWGFIGFGLNTLNYSWVDSHIAIFKAYAVTLGIAIAKENDAVLLKDAKESAEKATRMKSDFLARMSHEIRTPMNAIVGWTHLALEKSQQSMDVEYLKRIQSSSKSLLGIINDILDFSKIEAGKLSIEKTPFDLEKLFADTSNMVAYRAFKKGLEFIYNIHPDVPRNLIGDPMRIGQILVNLVNNAVKFTHEGYVFASVRTKNETDETVDLLFEVEDTGIGIKLEFQDALFDSFSQADVSTTRKFGGTGLGLAICKKLTGLMEGEIWVESEYGIGSQFKFILRLEKQKHNGSSYQLPQGLKTPKVLLVVEKPKMTKVLSELVSYLGFEYDIVGRTESMEMFQSVDKRKYYQLAIVDWVVQDQKDEEVVAAFIQKHRLDLPFLLLHSAFEDGKRFQTLSKRKHVLTLIKPFGLSDLYDSILVAMGVGSPGVGRIKTSPSHYLNELKSLDNICVLLVEDNEANQQIGVELLQLAGINVEVAENGKVAVDMVRSHKGKLYYDLILMDIQMPVMDGLEATHLISEMYTSIQLPIIAMTADALGEARDKYLKAGMVDMIAKPIEPDEMYGKIAQLMWQRKGAKSVSEKQTEIEGEVPLVNSSLPEISGINVADGVKRFVNRWDFFSRLLSGFYRDYQQFMEELKQYLDTDSREQVVRMLHSFKGMTGTIAAEKLYSLAVQLEKSYLDKTPDFQNLLVQAEAELDALLNELSECEQLNV
jgi:PAS domain S-box-containing protein